MKLTFRNEKGFTLGELLVVIAIMTVLVGVAVGAFTGLIGSGKSESAKFEKEAVQSAVESYLAMSGTTVMNARSSAAAISSSDSDAPFSTYMRRLPTSYQYTWTASGSVTQHGAPSGGGGGSTPSGPTPIAIWHFDEGSGIAASDSVGNNHGIVSGGAQWIAGRVGNCLRFNTTDDNDYVIVNPFAGFPSDEITVEFWMRSSDTSRNGSPISYSSAASDNDFLIYNYNSFSIYRASTNTSTSISPNDGSWHHIAVTWRSSDGATRLYRDGVPVYSGTLATGTTITAGGSLVFAQEQDSIGGGFAANQAFEGDIDEIVMYDEVLDDAEILADYNSY